MKIKTNYANTPVWREINVKSRIPESLKMLEVMARNIWWAWNDDATEMFRELDPELWRAVGQNPVALLERLNYEKLEALSVDKEMLGKINAIYDRFTEYMSVNQTKPSVCSLFLYGIRFDSCTEDLFWWSGYLGR